VRDELGVSIEFHSGACRSSGCRDEQRASGLCSACQENTVAAPAGKTAVSITRSTDMLYFGSSASVEINGVKVASLGRGETYAADIAPGPTVVSVSSWSSPGASSYSFSAQRGKTYQLAVKPRGGNFAAAMVGGLVGQAVEGHGQFEIAPTP
jgi:hypothetical protein